MRLGWFFVIAVFQCTVCLNAGAFFLSLPDGSGISKVESARHGPQGAAEDGLRADFRLTGGQAFRLRDWPESVSVTDLESGRTLRTVKTEAFLARTPMYLLFERQESLCLLIVETRPMSGVAVRVRKLAGDLFSVEALVADPKLSGNAQRLIESLRLSLLKSERIRPAEREQRVQEVETQKPKQGLLPAYALRSVPNGRMIVGAVKAREEVRRRFPKQESKDWYQVIGLVKEIGQRRKMTMAFFGVMPDLEMVFSKELVVRVLGTEMKADAYGWHNLSAFEGKAIAVSVYEDKKEGFVIAELRFPPHGR